MEIVVKMVERSSEGAGGSDVGGDAGDSFPAAGIMGERRPLAPFLHGFMGALPQGSMGEAKTWLWWLQIRGWRCPPRARVPPFI
jgi:hypothetical protein